MYQEWFPAMDQALELARLAAFAGEIPVGAVIVAGDGTILATAHNLREKTHDPTAHAEVLAIRATAAKLKNWNLSDCTLVVTLEPCLLCAATIQAARIGRVVFAAWDDKAGAAGSLYDILRDRRLPYRTEVISGVRAGESIQILKEFFANKRD